MYELERQAYLKALGIAQYVAQSPIAGAMESPVLTGEQIYPPHYFEDTSVDDAALQQTAADYLEGAPPNQVAGSDAPVSQVQEAPAQVVHRETNKPTEEPKPRSQEPISTEGLTVNIPQELLADAPKVSKPSKVESAMATFEFCFAWVETQKGIAMLIELGDAGVKDLSAQEHQLMGDIYNALDIPADQCRYQYFKWPLVNNPKIKQGEEEAKETLLGYMEGKLNNKPASALIAFGELPCALLGIQSQQMNIAGQQLMTAAVPSPKAMMADWQNKAKAWRVLAPLRGRSF